jgi:antitoxin VapB
LPGNEAIIRRDGNRLIIEPVPKQGLAALLDSWAPMDETFPEIEDLPPVPQDIF